MGALCFPGIALAKRLSAGLLRLHEAASIRGPLFGARPGVRRARLGPPGGPAPARAEPAADLAGTPARVAGAGPRHAFRDALVVAEVAMAVVLLAGAGLLFRSYQRLQAVDPGFDPHGVLVAFAQNRRVHNMWQNALPSRFVDELPEAFIEVAPMSNSFGGHSLGGYGASRFDDQKPFTNTYATPGWQRAQERWSKGEGLRSTPKFIEGEMVTHGEENPR